MGPEVPRAREAARHDCGGRQAADDQERVEPGRRARRAVHPQHLVLGGVRAAGQHHAGMGRHADRLAEVLRLAGPVGVVPVLQPVHDLRPRAGARHVLEAAVQGRLGTVDGGEDGDRLDPARRVVHRDGARRGHDRRREGQLDVAIRMHAHPHHRRALPVADRAVARDQGIARAHGLDDDGHLARVVVRRQLPVRRHRHPLRWHAEADVLPAALGHRHRDGSRHVGLQRPDEARACDQGRRRHHDDRVAAGAPARCELTRARGSWVLLCISFGWCRARFFVTVCKWKNYQLSRQHNLKTSCPKVTKIL